MMKTWPRRSSTASSSAAESSHSTGPRCGPNISDLTTRPLLRHYINRPEFPELKRQNFRNPQFAPILAQGEELAMAYKLVRDMFVFTNKRLILVNRQGVTGSKTEYLTIPYSKIVRFSKESAGLLDLDAELKIWVLGQNEPIKKEGA